MISQDMVTNLWGITAVSILETDDKNNTLAAYYNEAPSLLKAFEGITRNIEKKDFLNIGSD